MTREEFRDKKSKDYRKYREDCGIKDPVYLDEIEDAYYQGMVDADEHPHWLYYTLGGWHGWYDNSDEEFKGITNRMPMPEPLKEGEGEE